ncbi:T-cell surface glycoprotein CD1b-3-like [Ursus maritimus]|uniref:T-cell surface glycoprotein CD1b-3-like n=1 Tax=Ursus maritimus TaxID=29073 RepID=A0A8M1G4J4_URSMA|nr:T-cell surface glycoprotein CD1b-3-like [Ursus maritimus]
MSANGSLNVSSDSYGQVLFSPFNSSSDVSLCVPCTQCSPCTLDCFYPSSSTEPFPILCPQPSCFSSNIYSFLNHSPLLLPPVTTTSPLSKPPLKPKSTHSFQSPELLPLLLPSLASTHLISSLSLPLSCNSQFLFPDPFQVQVVKGCELHFGKALECYLRIAYQGSDLVNFQNMTWQPSPKGGSRAQQICKLFNQYYVVNKIVHVHINDILPRFFLGLLDAGKAYLLRQVRPEAWLSTGPSPGPGRLLLVCHVSGFYPKSVGVMWMRGEQEQRGTQRGDILPHADGTWYLRVMLDVVAREAAGLSCRVRHSSLGGQVMVLYWGEKELDLAAKGGGWC